MTSFDLSGIDTPALVLDEARMRANLRRLADRRAPFDVVLRPHLKTAKSVDVARQLLAGGNGPATVSTLREAEYFAAAGVRDILYAVGIAPGKLGRVKALRDAGCDLAIVLDSVEQARAVVDAAAQWHDTFPTLIEIDCDGHRSGLGPDDPRLVEVGRILHDGGVELRGVMTHAGESYGAGGSSGGEGGGGMAAVTWPSGSIRARRRGRWSTPPRNGTTRSRP